MINAEKAAKIILQGVEKNRGLIVFPFFYRFLWWLYRVHPDLLNPFTRFVVNFYRGLRQES